MRTFAIPGYSGPIRIPKQRNWLMRILFGSKLQGAPVGKILLACAEGRTRLPLERTAAIIKAFYNYNPMNPPQVPLLQIKSATHLAGYNLEQAIITFDAMGGFHMRNKRYCKIPLAEWHRLNTIELYFCWCLLRQKFLESGANAIGWMVPKYLCALTAITHPELAAEHVEEMRIWTNGILLREMNEVFKEIADPTAIPLLAYTAMGKDPYCNEALEIIRSIVDAQPTEDAKEQARAAAIAVWQNKQVLLSMEASGSKVEHLIAHL